MRRKRIICPKCDGEGEYEKSDIDPFMAVATLGISVLIDMSFSDTVECRVCDGDGYIIEERD